MPWLRNGDNAATYPPLMSVMGSAGADERTLNEVAGFVWRLGCQSAAHTTDYVIDVGTAWMIGGARTEHLLRLCTRAGLLRKMTDPARGAVYALVEDKDFLHVRLKVEIEWERQQRRDTRDPRLKAPIILRDGDNCRWCGVGVHWTGSPSNRTGEMDHLHRGQAGTVGTMVVACRGCNGARGGATDDTSQWDDSHGLRPVPAIPNYGPWSARYLTQHGYPTDPNYGAHLAPATASGADPAPAAGGVRPATAPSLGADPALSPGVRPATTRGADSDGPARSSPGVRDSCSDEFGLVGSGRDGSGRDRDGPGQVGSGVGRHGSVAARSAARRRRRGRRGRSGAGGGQG